MPIGAAAKGNNVFSQSKLPNGIRVATVNSIGPCVAGGVLIETRDNAAQPCTFSSPASLFVLDKLAFKATRNLTEAKLHAKLDALIGAVQTKRGREAILYSGAVTPTSLNQLMELLHEVICQPLVTDADLQELRQVVEYELFELHKKPDDLLLEMAHGPAFYSNQAMPDPNNNVPFMDWNSILAMGRGLEDLKVEDVMAYWKAHYTPEKMILLGAGVAHEELLAASESLFTAIPSSSSSSSPLNAASCKLKYIGGSNYIENTDLPLTHMVLGFEGAALDSPDAFPMAVLQMLMGGGSSFSAGGPGKGMYSRLYTQVLNRYHFVESCKIFNFSYHDAGLFGIQASCLPSDAGHLMEVILEQLHSMKLPLAPTELLRAKNQVKSAVLMGLESRLIELEDLGDQVSNTGSWLSPVELCRKIDGVSEEDLQAMASKLLSSPMSVVAYGPLHRMPSPDRIKKLHQQYLSSRRPFF